MVEKTRNPELGARAKARRETLGLSRVKLAAILEVGSQRLWQMELDGVESLSIITRWANALGLSPQDLAFGTPELDSAAGIKPKKKPRKS